MTIFVVTARAHKPDLENAISQAYQDKQFKFSDRTWFVSDVGTSKQVSEKIGVKKGGITGVVVMPMAGTYYGVASSTLWEWLRAAAEESDDG
jgi:hypothetical protein